MPLPPTSVRVGNADIPVWTWGQLTNLSRTNLKIRAIDLRQSLGESNCPPLKQSADRDTTVAWIISLQVAIARQSGLMLSASDFGVPASSMSDAPAPLNDKELARLWAAGVHNPSTGSEVRSAALTAAPFPYPTDAPNPNPWARPPASTRDEFGYSPQYAAAAADSFSAAATLKARNRGSLGEFLFSGGEPQQLSTPYTYRPPFQIAPEGRLPPIGSTTAHAYRPPPSAAYRQ